jgi:hypothetical protein
LEINRGPKNQRKQKCKHPNHFTKTENNFRLK